MSNKPIRHGEVMLVPISKLPSNLTPSSETSYIVGHSETGHHHVLNSNTKFEVFMDEATQALYLDIPAPADLEHLKTFDKHKTLRVAPGRYKVVHKTEYDPFSQVIRQVWD